MEISHPHHIVLFFRYKKPCAVFVLYCNNSNINNGHNADHEPNICINLADRVMNGPNTSKNKEKTLCELENKPTRVCHNRQEDQQMLCTALPIVIFNV